MTGDRRQLIEVFRAAAPRWGVAIDDEMIAGWVTAAIEAWPAIVVPLDGFVRHLARHLEPGSVDLHAADLYLAHACAQGHAGAIAAFEASCIARISPSIWQVSATDREDVLQQTRERLLVGSGAEPGIARYGGRGSLRGWVRSIVLRTAIKQAHAGRRMVELDEPSFLELAASSDDPVLEPYKQQYREEFRAAFRAAVDGLDVRGRNLLRHYFIDHMSIDELGTLYRVHRATAARWIHQLRTELVTGVRRELADRLADRQVGLHSLIDLVASQLDLSLERLIGDHGGS